MHTHSYSLNAPSRLLRLVLFFLLLLLTSQLFLPNNSLDRESLVARTGMVAPRGAPQAHLKWSRNQVTKLEVKASLPESEADDPVRSFITSLKNGEKDQVRGVYIPGVFALPVVEQPTSNPVYVSEEDGFLTLYRSAANNGVTGLLAHNYLSGAKFSEIQRGSQVDVIYGDGVSRGYKVEDIRRFQKLEPANLSSDLIDLDTGRRLTAGQVFDQVYRGSDHVTLQTCLEKEGNLSWGLLFIIASPRMQ